jgi:molybdopterin synthase sulfur carrier subunit
MSRSAAEIRAPMSGGSAGVQSDATPGAPTVLVHLPRSLVALFPDADRRVVVRGATVGEVIDELDRMIPGMRNRLVDAGPEIRTHLNVFVNGRRSSLGTAVPPGADVHVIPAVSGG